MQKLLIVEDTLAIREEIFDILTMEGYIVFQAENGRTGFEIALKEKPYLIISDILMPDTNGIEMFEKLKKHAITRDIPVIFLSAKGAQEDIRKGMNLGAEDYLTKPINIEDLLNAIKNKIQKRSLIVKKFNEHEENLSDILQNQKDDLDNYDHLISHELKSSLRNISDLLVWTKEDLKDSTNFIASNSKFDLLSDKLKEMELLLVKLEEYKNITSTSFKKTNINLNILVKHVISKIDSPKHITINVKNTLPIIYADEQMLKKVFEILLQNAVDHINKKEGLVELKCDSTEKHYMFSVKDNGIGINPKYHQKIFKMFQTIESKSSTGLGLSIVEKIISHYKGEINVKSTPNEETIFYFNLSKDFTKNDITPNDR